MKDWFSNHKWELIGLFVVLGWATYLRVGHLGTNSFGFDEARVSHMALQMARDGNFAQMGMQSSTLVPNLPAVIWIFAIPYWITADPLGANIFIGLLGVTAVLATYILARQAWGIWAGLGSALLLAASPMAVAYSRSVWSQDFLIPFATFWALTGVIGVARQKSWALALHAFLAGFIFQIHFAGIPLILGSIWLGLRYQLWKQWKPIVVGGLLAALAILPYVQIVWCCGPGAQQEWQMLFELPYIINDNVLQTVTNIATGSNWESLLVGLGWEWAPPLSTMLTFIWWLLLLMMGAGFVLAIWLTYRFLRTEPTWESVLTTMLPVWVLVVPLYHVRFKTEVGNHYFLTMLPGLILLVGLLIGWQRNKRWWTLGFTAVLLTIALIQTNTIIQALNITAQQFTENGMGTPLSYHRDAARSLQDGSPIVLHTFDDNAAYAGDAATFSILLWDYPHRIVDGRSVILFPATENNNQPVHLMTTYDNIPAWQELVANGIVDDVQTLPRRPGELPYLATTVTDFNPSHFTVTDPIRLENGATLLGWHARENNGVWRFFTMWQVAQQPTDSNTHQFNHFRDSSSADPVAIHDTRLSSGSWQDGDTIITWVDFHPEGQSGPFWVDVGMYTWPDVVRTPRLDHEGDPLQPIRLGPFGE